LIVVQSLAAFFAHGWRADAPLIDIRTFTHTRAGAAAGVFTLFSIAFVTAHTSYVLLCGFSVVLGFGMGLAMMPTMTAAMQAVPAASKCSSP
jgi:hypothetical protein